MPNAGKPHDDEVPRPPRMKEKHTEPLVSEDQIEGSMHTEEPTGWDQAPQDIHDPKQKRHPRPDGQGGLIPADDPDA